MKPNGDAKSTKKKVPPSEAKSDSLASKSRRGVVSTASSGLTKTVSGESAATSAATKAKTADSDKSASQNAKSMDGDPSASSKPKTNKTSDKSSKPSRASKRTVGVDSAATASDKTDESSSSNGTDGKKGERSRVGNKDEDAATKRTKGGRNTGKVAEAIQSSSSSAASGQNGNQGAKRARSDDEVVAKKPKTVVACAVDQRGPGRVLCLGQGEMGQLGQGDTVIERCKPALIHTITTDSIAFICAGGMHTVLLNDKSEVITFGCNDEGALGRKTVDAEDDPDGETEFDPAKAVGLPADIVQISAGDSHTAALTSKGQVYIWGNFRDNNGLMGLVTTGNKEEKPVRLRFEDEDIYIVKIASGCDHLVCLDDAGIIYTCGNAESGQLGRISERFSNRGGRRGLETLLTPRAIHAASKTEFDDIWAGNWATFAHDKKQDAIYAFGLNNHYQLGWNADSNPKYMPTLIKAFRGRKWRKIAPGQHHTIMLDDCGQVYSLGRAEYGRLGYEPMNGQSVAVPMAITQLKDCVDIAAGISISYAVTRDGKIKAWGSCVSGLLGQGGADGEKDSTDPIVVTSKHLEGKAVVAVSVGGQHAVFLAKDVGASKPVVVNGR